MNLADRTRLILQEMGGKDYGKQTRLAEIAGCARAVVHHWLSGAQEEMRYDHASKIAKKLGYRLDWLMAGRGPKRDGEQDAIMVEAEPSMTPEPSLAREQQPALGRELFLDYVTLDELRLLSSYRKSPDHRKMFDDLAKVIAAYPHSEVK